MTGIDLMLTSHKLNVIPSAKPVKQKVRRFYPNCHQIIQTKVDNLLRVGFIREVKYPNLIRDTFEKVSLIRQRLLAAQSRQKSYADVRRRPLEFEVRDHVFLKVMPKRGVVRFGKRGKLSPRFIGPFEILERIGTVAYRLALLPSMSGVHEVFHVSMLQKYTPDPAHVVDWGQIEVDTDGTFEEGLVCIVDSRDQVLRRKTVRLVLVLWRHYGVEESTWECEDTIRATYPFLFRDEDTWFSRLRFK